MKRLVTLTSMFIIILLSAAYAKVDETKYQGVWQRQATYVNGQLVGQDPAKMTLKKDSFASVNTACETGGSLSVNGSAMKMVMTQCSCPGVRTPYTVNYAYTISDDGNVMTFIVGPMKEIYKRISASKSESGLQSLGESTQTPSKMIDKQNESKKNIIQKIW